MTFGEEQPVYREKLKTVRSSFDICSNKHPHLHKNFPGKPIYLAGSDALCICNFYGISNRRSGRLARIAAATEAEMGKKRRMPPLEHFTITRKTHLISGEVQRKTLQQEVKAAAKCEKRSSTADPALFSITKDAQRLFFCLITDQPSALQYQVKLIVCLRLHTAAQLHQITNQSQTKSKNWKDAEAAAEQNNVTAA